MASAQGESWRDPAEGRSGARADPIDADREGIEEVGEPGIWKPNGPSEKSFVATRRIEPVAAGPHPVDGLGVWLIPFIGIRVYLHQDIVLE